MPFGTIHQVKVRGITCALPDNKVYMRSHVDKFDAEELKRMEEETGVISTCQVMKHQTGADLCYEAAEELLKKLGWERDSIGAVFFISTTPDYKEPATSGVIQHRLGLSTDCIAEDINLGCSAFVYGLASVGSLMQTSDIKRALLLCGENASQTADPSSLSSLLYGDAGSATALERDETDPDPIRYLLCTDGHKYKTIFSRNGSSRHPEFDNVFTVTTGVDVFAFSVREVPKTIVKFMEHFEIKSDDVDLYAFYQANEKVIGRIIKWCKLPPEKVPMTLTKFGNTGAASVPVVILSHLLGTEKRETDLHVLMMGFGAGLSWGVADMVVSKDAYIEMFHTRNYYDDDNDRTVTAP